MRGIWVLLACLGLLSCGGGSASGQIQVIAPPSSNNGNRCDSEPDAPVVSAGTIVPRQNFHSLITTIDYPLDIYLPASYASSTASYPVIYATDGQWSFDGFAGLLDEYSVEAILVSVHQGPHDRRWTDYTQPGSNAFLEFLEMELLPYIESEYRIDTTNRTLQGASLGGLLALHAMLSQDDITPTYKNIIAMDASLWYEPQKIYSLENERFQKNTDFPVNLVLTTALGYQGNFTSVSAFRTHILSRNYTSLNLYYDSFSVCHDQVANPSFEFAIQNLF